MTTQITPTFLSEDELESKFITFDNTQDDNESVEVYDREGDELYFVRGYN